MYSVEHNTNWVNKYPNVTYIHAPILNYLNDDPILQEFPLPNSGWYDIDVIKKEMPEKYDLIIIDGPVGATPHDAGRGGFYKYLDTFNIDIPMIFHDTNRPVEKLLVEKVSEKLNIPHEIISGQVLSAIIYSI